MVQYYNQPKGLDPLQLLMEDQRLAAMEGQQRGAGSSLLGAAMPLAGQAMLSGLGSGGPQVNFAGGQQALNLAAASGMRAGPTNAAAAMIPTAQPGAVSGVFGGLGGMSSANPYAALAGPLMQYFGK